MSENKETPKYFADQIDGETVEFVFRRHPIVMRKGLVLGMFGPLLGVIPAALFPTLGFGWFYGGLANGDGLTIRLNQPSI